MRIDRGYGPFGAAADRSAEAQTALAALVPDDGELWIVEGAPWPVPPGTREVKRAVLAQMVAEDAPPAARDSEPPMLSLSDADAVRSEEHTSELQSLMRISYAVFCLNKKKN